MTYLRTLGQKSKNNFVRFLVLMRTRKFVSEIQWPFRIKMLHWPSLLRDIDQLLWMRSWLTSFKKHFWTYFSVEVWRAMCIVGRAWWSIWQKSCHVVATTVNFSNEAFSWIYWISTETRMKTTVKTYGGWFNTVSPQKEIK